MRRRAASWWLAKSLGALCVAMFVADVALLVLARSADVPNNWGADLTVGGLLVVPFLAFPLVGALISSRRHHNPVGWICLADGLLWTFIGVILRKFPKLLSLRLYHWGSDNHGGGLETENQCLSISSKENEQHELHVD